MANQQLCASPECHVYHDDAAMQRDGQSQQPTCELVGSKCCVFETCKRDYEWLRSCCALEQSTRRQQPRLPGRENLSECEGRDLGSTRLQHAQKSPSPAFLSRRACFKLKTSVTGAAQMTGQSSTKTVILRYIRQCKKSQWPSRTIAFWPSCEAQNDFDDSLKYY